MRKNRCQAQIFSECQDLTPRERDDRADGRRPGDPDRLTSRCDARRVARSRDRARRRSHPSTSYCSVSVWIVKNCRRVVPGAVCLVLSAVPGAWCLVPRAQCDVAPGTRHVAPHQARSTRHPARARAFYLRARCSSAREASDARRESPAKTRVADRYRARAPSTLPRASSAAPLQRYAADTASGVAAGRNPIT